MKTNITKRLGRLTEIAKAPSHLDPYFEQMVKSFNEKVGELPSPPPGYYYGPVITGVKREGNNWIVEGEISLRPIIEPEKDDKGMPRQETAYINGRKVETR